jgi:hypothetical protein
MENTKPALTSKTIVTNLALAILAALSYFKVLPEQVNSPEVIGLVAMVGNVLAAWFRKTATTEIK